MALPVATIPAVAVGACVIAKVVARQTAAKAASRTAGSVKTTRDTATLSAILFPPLIDDIDIEFPTYEKGDIQFSDEVKKQR